MGTTTREIWARQGGDISLYKSHLADTYTFRITDAKGEVTIRFDVTAKSLRSLRKWIGEVLKQA